jgi:hypothetical protein
MTPAQFWQIEMQNQQNQQAQQQQNQQNIMSGIMGVADAYAENKQLEAKAGSYDDIGKILNTAMFRDNPDASAAFGNLQKEKDPRKKVMGYEQLFSLVGPMSNMMMAQSRLGVQQQAPIAAANLQNLGAVSRGEGTYGVPGMDPVEPDLPELPSRMQPGAGMNNSVGRFAPSQNSVGAARRWFGSYAGPQTR